MATTSIPHPGGRPYVTDGGLETDLIYHHDADLPAFAAFPLVEDDGGRAVLRSYYEEYAGIARRAGTGLMLETPTWRANPDWGDSLGYDRRGLDRVNQASVEMLTDLRESAGDVDEVLVGGVVGPRGDGYVPGERMHPDEAAAYHASQVHSFAVAGADLVSAYTLTTPEEGIGVVRAARDAGLPVAISFTVETDGRLPDGTPLGEAVTRLEEEEPADYYLLNCAHPDHIEPALTGDAEGADEAWRERVLGLLPNASRMSHAELDAAEDLDDGDPAELALAARRLRSRLPNLEVLGGCCGTDSRHVAALWGVA